MATETKPSVGDLNQTLREIAELETAGRVTLQFALETEDSELRSACARVNVEITNRMQAIGAEVVR